MMMTGLELHEACTVGDYDALEDYLKSGNYNVNMKDPEWQNRTPLHWACTKGYADCVRILLDSGAKGTARMSMGWTPAHCAAEVGKLTVLRTLCTSGVAIDKRDKYGDTPRRVAEMYGHAECVKYLLQAEREQAEQRANSDNALNNDEESDWDDDESLT